MTDENTITQKPTKILHYIEDEFPFIISKRVVDILRSSRNFFGLMVLFLCYCDMAREQKTDKIYANTKVTKQKIKVGANKVQLLRRELIQLGLVKEIKTRKQNGKLKPIRYHLLWDIGAKEIETIV